jgi:hypothetical protein
MRKTLALFVFAILFSLASSTLAQQRFPIEAEQYRQIVSGRVEATWEKIEKKLNRNRVSDDRKQEIRSAFDEAVARINEALDKASADGQISRGEAYRINTMTSGLRGKLRGKLAHEKSAERAATKSEASAADRAPASKSATSKGADKGEDVVLDSNAPKSGPARKASPSEKHRAPKARAAAKTKKPAR